MHGEDDEVTVEVNGEELNVDPDATRTIRFPPPKPPQGLPKGVAKGVERPPPEPPQWWEPDAGDGRQAGQLAAGDPPERSGRPSVGPPPGPIQPPPGLNAFQAPPNPLGQPVWEPSARDVPVFPPPRSPGAPLFPPLQNGAGTPVFPPPPSGQETPSPSGQEAPLLPPPRSGGDLGTPVAGTTAESLRPERLLRTRRRPPTGGWRKAIHTLSGGLIHLGDSKAERRRQELIERIRQPVTAGHFRVAVMSLKGGVGKTTTTIGLGSTLAHNRGDRVIAVDANPDRGTLSEKLRMESPATVRHLLNDRGGLWRYADVRSYTSQAPSRLEVLASDRDPAISEAFNADDYRAVAQILEQFYSIAITDCGTGMLHSAMSAILDMADQIVLVSPVTVDGARSASATLDWLQAHGHGNLAVSAVVVLSAVKNPRRNAVNVTELKEHFTQRCRAVIGVPFDPHLEQGSEVDLDLLRTSTRDMYLEVAATIADRFNAGAAS
ncbi:MinD/ParA family protein [Nonomuraea sp. PA05]|uniref:MinD/ParA family ATP-binding protein n=1 Tax=Nonomuraea sp. PA05 TaxID=2604466 RepID=UPI001CA33FF5|nr:MinD/ParA family protein [Nonomuraea sp. PA05]